MNSARPMPPSAMVAGAGLAGAPGRCRRGRGAGARAARDALAGRRHRGDGTRATFADLDVQVAGDRVLRIQLERGVERRGRLVQLPELQAASRQPRPRPLVGRRQPGDLFVDTSGVGTEIGALRKIDGALLEGCQLVHSPQSYPAEAGCNLPADASVGDAADARAPLRLGGRDRIGQPSGDRSEEENEQRQANGRADGTSSRHDNLPWLPDRASDVPSIGSQRSVLPSDLRAKPKPH